MEWLFPCLFLFGVASAVAGRLWHHMQIIDAQNHTENAFVDTDRYLPMLRLLSLADQELVADPIARRKLRSQRVGLFRHYLRNLTEDYGTLLAGLRRIMTQSGVDRPDLAKALARNRALFAIVLCRIEFRLWVYALGVGNAKSVKRDVQGLVDALKILRGQFSFVESAVWGA